MLSVQQLGKRYGDRQVLHDVSFDIGAGEIVALLGANGSGKTTTVNSICRLLDWEQGTITFEGADIRQSPSYLRHVGAVLGGCRNVNWRLTASQNALYFARLRGASKKQVQPIIAELEKQLGLEQYHKKVVGKLSTGNKQKSSLLSALAYQPKLLLLDEPTLGLDMETVSELQSIIVQQSQQLNQGFLITSHDLMFIDKICHRVIVLEQGKVIFNGDIASLKQQLFHYEMRLSLTLDQQSRLMTDIESLWPAHIEIEQQERQIIVRYDAPEHAFATTNWLAQQQIAPQAMSIEPLSIETAYHCLLNKELNL